jgi:hypothetical protein
MQPITCSKCGERALKAANRLGECAECHRQRIDRIRTNGSAIRRGNTKWMREVENRYRKTIYYSDEYRGEDVYKQHTLPVSDLKARIDDHASKERLRKRLGPLNLDTYPKAEINLREIPKEVIRPLVDTGLADGFLGRGKCFDLMVGRAPSKAIRSFITGRLTVCECEGLMFAVLYNSMRPDWRGRLRYRICGSSD